MPLPAGSLGQIWPVSASKQQILFSPLCQMSYFCLFSGGGWAKPLSPGCCSAPLPGRCEGVWTPSCSLCDPAKSGLQRADTAKQGGLQCLSSCAVDKQKSSPSSAAHLASFLSSKIDLKKNLKEKEKNDWCYFYLVFCNGV